MAPGGLQAPGAHDASLPPKNVRKDDGSIADGVAADGVSGEAPPEPRQAGAGTAPATAGNCHRDRSGVVRLRCPPAMDNWKTRSNHAVRRLLAGRSNVYLLAGHSGLILVDTGRRNRWPDLKRQLTETGVARLDALVLTHSHFDHAENARRIRDTFRAAVIVHESEAAFLERGDTPLPAGSVLLTRIFTPRLRRFLAPRFRYDGCPADVTVKDRLDLSPWGFNGYLLHTPGHCRGAMSVALDDEIALVGDTMVNAGPWSVFPPFADDVAQLLESWKRLLETGCRIFLPGHGTAIGRPLLERRFEERRGSSVPTATAVP